MLHVLLIRIQLIKRSAREPSIFLRLLRTKRDEMKEEKIHKALYSWEKNANYVLALIGDSAANLSSNSIIVLLSSIIQMRREREAHNRAYYMFCIWPINNFFRPKRALFANKEQWLRQYRSAKRRQRASRHIYILYYIIEIVDTTPYAEKGRKAQSDCSAQ